MTPSQASNVLLYAYDPSDGRHERALDLVSTLGRTRRGALSVQVLQQFYVNAVSKIAVPLSPSAARARLQALARWTVHSPLAADVIAATALSEEHRISFRDAMVIRSSIELGAEILWTEDLNHGQLISGVRVLNPFVAP